MTENILLSTAYLPPIEYLWHVVNADSIQIENEENYPKQTYRNRCRILTSNGMLSLSIPVLTGNAHKTAVKDLRIDYSKKWKHNHLKALTSAYSSSPFFLYYYEDFERIIMSDKEYLIDLNTSLLELILKILKIDKPIGLTNDFTIPEGKDNDLRYSISPKETSTFNMPTYMHTFDTPDNIEGLSIVDMLFNIGEDAKFLLESH